MPRDKRNRQFAQHTEFVRCSNRSQNKPDEIEPEGRNSDKLITARRKQYRERENRNANADIG